MAALAAIYGSLPVVFGSTGSTVGIVVVILIILAAVAFAILYSTNEEFKEKVSDAFGASAEKAPKQARNIIRLIGTDDFNALMASIGSYLTGIGYVPQSQAPGLHVYQKQEHKKPSAIIALLLFFFCIIPMIIYLAKGGGVKTSLVTIQVRKTQDAYYFDIKAPAGVGRNIYGFLQPYLIPTETIAATPE